MKGLRLHGAHIAQKSRFISAFGEEISALARNVHKEGIFSETPFFESKFYKYFQNTNDEPDTYLGLKVFLGDKILGFFYAYIGG